MLAPSRSNAIVFFFNDTATTEIYTLSLHDALPISSRAPARASPARTACRSARGCGRPASTCRGRCGQRSRSCGCGRAALARCSGSAPKREEDVELADREGARERHVEPHREADCPADGEKLPGERAAHSRVEPVPHGERGTGCEG